MIWLNSRPVNIKKYPNGETLFDNNLITMIHDTNYVDFRYENDSDLIALMFLKRFIDTYSRGHCILSIGYMPYSRMDRVENCSVFTLKYICEFINSLCFDQVTVLEPHSDVTPSLLNNVISFEHTLILLNKVAFCIDFNKEKDYIFLPDSGAMKRYKLKGFKTLVGIKQRNFKDGKITKLDIYGEIQDKDFKVIIIDDLCSAGGTFIMSAKKLKEMGASEIYLAVTHCEETIYKGDIFKTDLINKVYTTNSIIQEAKNDRIDISNIYN